MCEGVLSDKNRDASTQRSEEKDLGAAAAFNGLGQYRRVGKNKEFEGQGGVCALYWLGEPAKVSANEGLTLKELTEDKNIVASEVIKEGVGAEVELLGTQTGVITKISGNHYWVELKGLNYLIKLTAG